MHFDDCFANRETEPETFPPRIGLFEWIKDSFDKLWFDAHAAVADLDADRLWVRIVRPYRNRAVFRREFASVAKDAPENFLQAWHVSDKLVPGRRQSDDELEMSIFHVAADDVHCRLEKLMRVSRA